MSKKIASIVHRIDGISEWSGRILHWLILMMLFIMLYEVIGRYVFNSPTIWALELATMTWGAYGVMAGAYVFLYRGHIANTILYERWSERKKAIADVVTFPLVIVFCVMLLWKGMHYGIMAVVAMEQSHSAWGPPLYIWKLTIPAGTLLLLLQGISKFIRDLMFIVKKEEL